MHKFFNIGQLDEIKMSKMAEGEVLEVLEKLDGQMVMGVVIDAGVEYWSRRGRTPTAVTASRVVREAVGQHDLLVQDVHNQRATAVFEMIGSQSRVKSDEEMTPQLVLIGVRAHVKHTGWQRGLGPRKPKEAVRAMAGRRGPCLIQGNSFIQ